MEPVTFTAILVGVAQAAGQAVVGGLVNDAYLRLKTTLTRKYGEDSEVAGAVESLESKPESYGRKETLKEELEHYGADQEPDVRSAAQELLDLLKDQPEGEQHIQSAVGSYIAQADRGSTATVNLDQHGQRPEE